MRPITNNVGDLIQQIRQEDHGIDRVALTTTGILFFFYKKNFFDPDSGSFDLEGLSVLQSESTRTILTASCRLRSDPYFFDPESGSF